MFPPLKCVVGVGVFTEFTIWINIEKHAVAGNTNPLPTEVSVAPKKTILKGPLPLGFRTGSVTYSYKQPPTTATLFLPLPPRSHHS